MVAMDAEGDVSLLDAREPDRRSTIRVHQPDEGYPRRESATHEGNRGVNLGEVVLDRVRRGSRERQEGGGLHASTVVTAAKRDGRVTFVRRSITAQGFAKDRE